MIIQWDTQAVEDLFTLARVDRRQAQRTLDAIVLFGRSGHGDIKALTGQPNQMRLRVGTWRVILRRDDDATVVVMRVRLRRDAYD